MEIDSLDRTALKEFVRDIGPATKGVIDLFITEIQGKMRELTGISDTTDIESLAIHAHSLKGLSGTCGMVGISDVAFKLETACRSGNRDQALAHFARIEKHIEPMINALTAFVDDNT